MSSTVKASTAHVLVSIYYYNLVPRPGWKNCSCMHAPAKVGNSDMHVDIFRVFDRRLEVSNDYAMRTSMLFP